MGCTSSSPVAPSRDSPSRDLRDDRPRPTGIGEPTPSGSPRSQTGGESEPAAAVADAVIQLNEFFDGASTVLETVAAAPDAISNFASALQDNAGDLRDAMTAIIGAAATITQAAACMTPAVVIVAPALAAVRALAKQLAQLRENAELAENLKAELAFADTLLLHAGRSELLAKDHAPLLNVICGAATDAAALVLRISRRSKFMSFVAAGSDGAKLRDTLSQLHDRFSALGTAAAVAGAAGISEVPAAIVEKVRRAAPLDLPRRPYKLASCSTSCAWRCGTTLAPRAALHDVTREPLPRSPPLTTPPPSSPQPLLRNPFRVLRYPSRALSSIGKHPRS